MAGPACRPAPRRGGLGGPPGAALRPSPAAGRTRAKAGERSRTRASTAGAAVGVEAEAGPLAQLAGMTTLSVDTGDLATVRRLVGTGLVTDATTNPLFVSQAGRSGDAAYQALVDEAVVYAVETEEDPAQRVALAVDRLAVNLGAAISREVPGYVSTEVNIYLSYDAAKMHLYACRMLAMYRDLGVDTSRVLIKLPGTWAGIQAAKKLEAYGYKTNITLVFGFTQAVAAAQAGAHLISPFPGRVLEWHKANAGHPEVSAPEDDPGVLAVKRMHAYFKKYGYETICMPASWRSPTGEDPLDEVLALAGVDRMTIPPALLDDLAGRSLRVERKLSPEQGAAECADPRWGDLDEQTFAWNLAMEGAATDKLGAGLRAFAEDTDKLTAILRAHPAMDLS